MDKKIKTFLNEWANEKKVLEIKMQENKDWNDKFRTQNNLTTKDEAYKKHKKTTKVAENRIASLLLNDIPNDIAERAALLESEYKIKGAVGKGNISEIPWICIFDRDITESAREGFYIVYLVRADLSGFYLSLIQGWTQYQDEFKPVSKARDEIEKNTRKLQQTLKTVSDFSFDKIDLKGSSDLAKGYELANICSKYYSADNLPNTHTLISDLQKLIGTYRELKSLVGDYILDIDFVMDEEEFQEKAQIGKKRTPKDGKVPKKKKVNGLPSSVWWRDPDMAYTALWNADFKCENQPDHLTFLSSITNNQFVEAHHLIPMKFQDEFEASIDVPENIISLCPNCHRAFHNSIDEVKTELIKKFYHKRKELLLDREISIAKNELLEYYNTNLQAASFLDN